MFREVPSLLERIVALSIGLRASTRELWDSTSDLPCTLPDLEVLVVLSTASGTHQVGWNQLQRRLALTSGALAHRLAKMEAAGHVRRLRATADRRQALVEATPDGLETLRRVDSDRRRDDLAQAWWRVRQRLEQVFQAAEAAP